MPRGRRRGVNKTAISTHRHTALGRRHRPGERHPIQISIRRRHRPRHHTRARIRRRHRNTRHRNGVGRADLDRHQKGTGGSVFVGHGHGKAVGLVSGERPCPGGSVPGGGGRGVGKRTGARDRCRAPGGDSGRRCVGERITVGIGGIDAAGNHPGGGTGGGRGCSAHRGRIGRRDDRGHAQRRGGAVAVGDRDGECVGPDCGRGPR